MKKSQKYILVGCAVLVALAGTAVASSYITRESMTDSKPVKQQAKAVHRTEHRQVAAAQPTPACDDQNIVGTLGGAVAGGVVGNQFGKGDGKKLATVGGVVGGAYLGNQYIPTRGAACQ